MKITPIEGPYVIHWFRRDLRLTDNTALFEALSSGLPVLPLFIFDTNILDKLEDRDDRRVNFIHQTLETLKAELESWGCSLFVAHGKPLEVYEQLLAQTDLRAVYTNRDHEPYARQRDELIHKFLEGRGVHFHQLKDITIFERNEVMKDDGKPYTVFTPYGKRWMAQLSEAELAERPSHNMLEGLLKCLPQPMPTLGELGFEPSTVSFPENRVDIEVLKHYHETRDRPDLNGTSKLSVHLRFGTISIRKLVRTAQLHNQKFLMELVWREFYQMIVWHFPKVENAFKPAYDRIKWVNNEAHFDAWCKGQTGYPLVDAGMRELAATGQMHNRVRMVVASFLTKHLLTDWRWGEAWFARHLLDFDLASNNGGWQWASGSGCDGAPYFRVFNPAEQARKFDPEWKYIRQWVPEVDELTYAKPIIDHVFARDRAIKTYRAALGADFPEG